MSERPQVVRARETAEPLSGTVTISNERHRHDPESSPHARKFVAVTAALVTIAIAAVVAAVVLLVRGGSSTPHVAWSAWSPPDGGIAGEREIADQVAPFYRATAATQLAVVTVKNVSGTGAEQVAVRDPNNGTLSGLTGTTAVYNLCGLGPNCAIAAGKPTSARLLLLRREALELSMYTFKYIAGISNVVAILPPSYTPTASNQKLTPKPPAPGTATKASSSSVDIAVVFQRDSLKNLLAAPLHASLPEQVPPTPSEMDSAPEAELVSVVTSQALFKQQLVQAQDGTSVLVLDPLPAQ